MQNADGGWGAFDRDNTREIFTRVPFADHNAMIDPSTADLTARMLEMFSDLGMTGDHPVARRALAFVWNEQEQDGAWFGRWLRRAGASVVEIRAEAAKPVSARAVAATLDAHPDAKLLSVVHAESASGIRNPLEAILRLARERDVLTVVDAVASLGGHAFAADALGADVVVVGPQKALAGPAGLSAVAVGPRAWAAIAVFAKA